MSTKSTTAKHPATPCYKRASGNQEKSASELRILLGMVLTSRTWARALAASTIILVGLIGLSACSSSKSVGSEFRDVYKKEYEVEASSAFKTTVTGTGCSRTIDQALRVAKQQALFNLRSVIGQRRYSPRLEEVQRYEEGGKVCAEYKARAVAN